MISYTVGNIFDSDCYALVNPVNCVGVMGAGLAAQFRKRYPRMFWDYQKVCSLGLLKPGLIHSYRENNKLIINFPTKDHWKDKSLIQYIDSGLETLIGYVQRNKVDSIAIPPLGCGLGGLDWKVVKPKIENAANKINIRVVIYEPT